MKNLLKKQRARDQGKDIKLSWPFQDYCVCRCDYICLSEHKPAVYSPVILRLRLFLQLKLDFAVGTCECVFVIVSGHLIDMHGLHTESKQYLQYAVFAPKCCGMRHGRLFTLLSALVF